MLAENTYVLINHGRIYKYPLKGPNPKGMTAWCDRYVFAEKGHKGGESQHMFPWKFNHMVDELANSALR
jgi:hypothetical protein